MSGSTEREKTQVEREKLLRLQYADNLKQNENEAAKFANRLGQTYKNSVTGIIHVALTDVNGLTAGTGGLDLDTLSNDDYIEYARNLDKSRVDLKRAWSDANEKYKDEGMELLDSYRKLHKIRSLMSKKSQVLSEEAQKELNATTSAKIEELLKKIEQKKVNYSLALEDLEYQDKTFRLFQQDQGRVIGTVEKHKVFKVKQERAEMRTDAHLAIIRALDSSPVMMQLDESERKETVAEVVGLLRELEDVEGETDELVQRLELKLSAIQMAEQSQSGEIEESLTRQGQINDKLDSLNDKILTNNELLRSSFNTFREDVEMKMALLPNPNAAKRILIAVSCALIVAISVWIAYMVYKYTK